MKNLLNDALALAKTGWNIIPQDRKKVPLIKDWPNKASSDEVVIRGWFKQWPRANIAAPTGMKNKIIVLEFDVKNPKQDGEATFKMLQKKYGKFATLIVRSPSGGWHVYFLYPTDMEVGNIQKIKGCPGMEVKGDGGCITLPPSFRSDGGKYEWLNDLPIASCPDWLKELLKSTKLLHDIPLDDTPQAISTEAEYSELKEWAEQIPGGVKWRGDWADFRCPYHDDHEPSASLNIKSVVFLCRACGEKGNLQKLAAKLHLPLPVGTLQGKQKMPSQATLLVEIAKDCELFNFDGEAYSTIKLETHKEHHLIKTKTFRRWLSREFYLKTEKAPGAQALQDAINVLEGMALFESQEHKVFNRVAPHGDNIYLDLANDSWESVEITSNGWSIIKEPPVRFRRPKGMYPLPSPIQADQGAIDVLFTLANCKNQEDKIMTLSWLLAAFRPIGPYPILTLIGEQETGKTTRARLLRNVIDPNMAPIRAAPRETRDLAIAASNSWVLSFDNLSHLQDWLSDALCRLSTGGGFATRTLYTDEEETIFEAMRPVLINGIEDLCSRGDILSRAIVLYLPRISKEKRLTEEVIWKEFNKYSSQILGALIGTISGILKKYPDILLKQVPRMADFAHWSVAAEPVVGWKKGSFLSAYEGNRKQASIISLEASILTEELKKITEKWEGTSADLLDLLEGYASDRTKKKRAWPKNPRALAGQLRRLSPNLKEIGIAVGFEGQHGSKRRRLISIVSAQMNAKNAKNAKIPTYSNQTDLNVARISPSGNKEALD